MTSGINGFQLEFAASGILNNPVKELYHCVTKLQDKEIRRTTWWLEPMAYFIDFEKAGKNVVLTITETDDLHNGTAESIPLLRITGEEKNILKPFRIALKNFFAQAYEEKHWQYTVNQNEINKFMIP